MHLLAPPVVALVIALAIYRTAPGRRRALALQILLVATGFLVYFGVRTVTEGSVATAVANGETIISIQQSLGIYVEPQLNAAAAARPWLMTLMNWIYIWGHWPFIAVVGIWLYLARPAGYRITRNAFVISGLMGLVLFALLPTAPPRLMDVGFVDTVTEHSRSYRLLQPPSVTNQYAAFPSLHFGWNLLVGIAVVRYARRPVARLVGVLSPVAMLVATVFTANHYILDVVAGGIIALLGLILAIEWHRRREATRGDTPERAPALDRRQPEAPAEHGAGAQSRGPEGHLRRQHPQ